MYNANEFRHHFQIQHTLFDHILHDLRAYDDYFEKKVHALGKPGFSTEQKLTAAFWMLAYGASADQLDEYIHMAESTCLNNLQRFCQSIIGKYGEEYLRAPTAEDLEKILALHASKGWPRMLGLLDVMKWEWKNCPVVWQGMYQGKEEVPTVALEAVVDHRLWFWHAWFGMPGSNNDINVLDQSPLLKDLMHGQAPEITFTVNGKQYKMGYYLADGIYPDWKIFIKTILEPQVAKHHLFAK